MAVPQVTSQFDDPRQEATPQSPAPLPTQSTAQVAPASHWFETPQVPVKVDDADVPQSTLQAAASHVVTPQAAAPPEQATAQVEPAVQRAAQTEVPVLPLQSTLQLAPLQTYGQSALTVLVQLKLQSAALEQVAAQASLLPSAPSATPLQLKVQSC